RTLGAAPTCPVCAPGTVIGRTCGRRVGGAGARDRLRARRTARLFLARPRILVFRRLGSSGLARRLTGAEDEAFALEHARELGVDVAVVVPAPRGARHPSPPPRGRCARRKRSEASKSSSAS